jgi:hypothetical protein
MRSVVVYPAGDQARTVAVLDALAQQHDPYHVDGCLHVSIVDDGEELPLFLAWEQEEIEAVALVVGHRPTWCVMIHMSWTIKAPGAARRLTLALLRNGGAAIDDYSSHPWTAEEIGEDCIISGRRFGCPRA